MQRCVTLEAEVVPMVRAARGRGRNDPISIDDKVIQRARVLSKYRLHVYQLR